MQDARCKMELIAFQAYNDLELYPSSKPMGRQILSAYLIYMLGTD
jgi:hypothetical protein